jgi:hypothetical protein
LRPDWLVVLLFLLASGADLLPFSLDDFMLDSERFSVDMHNSSYSCEKKNERG